MRGTGDVKALLQQKIDSSIRIMLGSRRGCAECHFMDEASDRVQRMEKSRELIPEIWLKHTQFNHDAHNLKDTGLKCVDCHRGADLEAKTDFSSEILASSKMPRKGAEELMMPTIDDCRVCHSASSPKAQAPFERVAADHRCVECHLYHRGTPHGK